MIVCKAPLRMSFLGGGSDIQQFYTQKTGAVISTAIDRYIYVTIKKKFDNSVRLAYSQNEEVEHASRLKHPLVKEALGFMGIQNGIEMTTIADIPSSGTGLGSSSTFTVATLHALSTFLDKSVSKEWLASQSCFIEIERCGEPIGKQDQYSSAYGGLNLIEFNSDETVSVKPVNISKDNLTKFQDSIIMFYTGVTRSASQLLETQSKKLGSNKDTFQTMSEMVDNVYVMKEFLENGKLDDVGRLLHEGWIMKKSLMDEISSPFFDDIYDRALQAGALGGKMLGAGAGGFLAFVAPPEKHQAIKNALSELKEVPVNFDTAGSQIILNERNGV